MGAAIARSYYLLGRPQEPAWRLDVAIRNRDNECMLEPHLLERLAVVGYRIAGHEALWIPRLLSVVFWLLGSVVLYRIGIRLSTPVGASVAVAVFLFSPFGILASRSFQPDPLMVLLELAGVLALLRFAESESTASLLLAAALCAAAVFVKPVCLPVVAGLYCTGMARRHGCVRVAASPHTWVFAVVIALPVAFYVWGMVWGAGHSDLGAQADGSIVPALLFTGTFWHGLMVMLGRVIGLVPLFLALGGVLLASERPPYQGSLLGLWLGYVAFTCTFTYHTHTHDYYHLQLVPIAALSIGALTSATAEAWMTVNGRRRTLAVLMVAIVTGASMAVWLGEEGLSRGTHSQRLKAMTKVVGAAVGVPQKLVGYVWPEAIGMSQQVAAARAVGAAVGHGVNTIYLGQDDGNGLTYMGEFSGVRWPSHGQLEKEALLGFPRISVEQRLDTFLRAEPGLRYFVVTDFGDLAQQPGLMQYLAASPLVAAGPGYAVHLLMR